MWYLQHLLKHSKLANLALIKQMPTEFWTHLGATSEWGPIRELRTPSLKLYIGNWESKVTECIMAKKNLDVLMWHSYSNQENTAICWDMDTNKYQLVSNEEKTSANAVVKKGGTVQRDIQVHDIWIPL